MSSDETRGAAARTESAEVTQRAISMMSTCDAASRPRASRSDRWRWRFDRRGTEARDDDASDLTRDQPSEPRSVDLQVRSIRSRENRTVGRDRDQKSDACRRTAAAVFPLAKSTRRRARDSRVRPSVRPSVMSKREKFFEAIRKQKTDTVRWSLGAGGQSPSVRDEDGNTAIMICAAGNLHKALRMLLDHCRRSREREQMDLRDGEGDGRTALMMAAHNGHREACQELLDAGCNFKLKCERGKTAADYARAKGHAELAARIDRGGESEEEDTDEDDANEHDPDAPEGETSTQRSKRKKRELEAKERRGAGGKELEAAKTDAATKKDADANEAAEAAEAAVASRPKPTWPDVEKAIAGNLKELALDARSATGGPGNILPAGVAVDPALWHATSVNTLKISLGAALTTLPSEISRLSGLMTLILSDNAMTSLPESIGELKRLKVLEAERNALTSVPSSLSDCACLEILRLGHNKLTSVKALAACNELVTLVLDDNELTTLDDLDVASKSRLVTLSAKKNAIERVPGNLGKCALLAELCLGDNAIENLPKSLGELKEKKVSALEFEGNPLRDPKIKKMMGKSANLVKELLTYVRKNGVEDGDGGGGGGRGGGRKKGKKGKNQAKREDSSDEDEDEDEDEAKRPAPEPEPAKPPPEKPPAAAAGCGGGTTTTRRPRTMRNCESACRGCRRRSARRWSARSRRRRRRKQRRWRRRSARRPTPRRRRNAPPPSTPTRSTPTPTTRRSTATTRKRSWRGSSAFARRRRAAARTR